MTTKHTALKLSILGEGGRRKPAIELLTHEMVNQLDVETGSFVFNSLIAEAFFGGKEFIYHIGTGPIAGVVVPGHEHKESFQNMLKYNQAEYGRSVEQLELGSYVGQDYIRWDKCIGAPGDLTGINPLEQKIQKGTQRLRQRYMMYLVADVGAEDLDEPTQLMSVVCANGEARGRALLHLFVDLKEDEEGKALIEYLQCVRD